MYDQKRSTGSARSKVFRDRTSRDNAQWVRVIAVVSYEGPAVQDKYRRPYVVQTLIPVVNRTVRLDGLGQLSSVFVPLLEPRVHNCFHRNVDV